MKISDSLLRTGLFLILIGWLLPASVQAQDTTVVQTLSFSDITKRRGKFLFPPSTKKYRKILMYYTLKCDQATTQDQFPCGEWDYLTYTTVYDPRGVYDSTYKTHPEFRVGTAAPDSFYYAQGPTWTYQQSWQYFPNHSATISLDTAVVGTGTASLSNALKSSAVAGKAQFIWTASELSAAGLTGGDISGMRLDLSALGSQLDHFRIALSHTQLDSLAPDSHETNLQEVYYLNTLFTAQGWNDLQFSQNFNWNGVDNLAVEFSYDAAPNGADNVLRSTATAFPSGIYTAGQDFALEFNKNSQYLNLGSDVQIEGANARTYECWAYTRSFNNAGVFQAGNTGTVAKDFSLRTRNTDDNWRVQCWGPPDFDATLPGSKGSWHHYAVTYDGSTTKLYFDGQFVTQESYPLSTPAHDLWIGRWAGSYFDGIIDDFRVWDVALSAATLNTWKDRDISPTHPDYANLLGWYPFNEGAGLFAGDVSPNAQTAGYLTNTPWWWQWKGEDLSRNWNQLMERPNVIFEKGVYTTTMDSVLVTDSSMNAPVQVLKYQNPATGVQIPDTVGNHPTLATDTLLVWGANTWSYTYGPDGQAVDSAWVGPDSLLINGSKEWYSPLSAIEIGRFITPYGINLDLGPQGFTWVYDITEYAPFLQDSVELSAGNQQELIDLKFVMIEGTPPRDEVSFQKIWGDRRSQSYRNMDDDVVMDATTLPVMPTTSTLMVRTRLTGHGHNSSTGNYPHCCEWKDNTHYLFVNGQQAHSWHIWKQPDCAMNPVWPQGGTWPGSREGWCPGDKVYDEDVNISPWVTGNSVTLDYDITPVPTNNPGMGSGNYVVAAQLLQFGPANHSLDAEVYDIVTPNDWEYYSRSNPICNDPKIVIRNAGSTDLDSVLITYTVSGGTPLTHTWTGSLGFMEKEEVVLPIPDETFWQGDGKNDFTVSLSNPNGGADQYADNNSYTTHFQLPDTLPNRFVIYLKTNKLPSETSYTVKDMDGNVVHSRQFLAAEWIYPDTLDLQPGCYTIELLDTGLDGLYYWAYTAQGTGIFRLYETNGTLMKAFISEFGYKIQYPFIVGGTVSVQEDDLDEVFAVYPNPSNGRFNVELFGKRGTWNLTVIDLLGKVILTESHTSSGDFSRTLDLSNHPKGVYVVQLTNGVQSYRRRVVVE